MERHTEAPKEQLYYLNKHFQKYLTATYAHGISYKTDTDNTMNQSYADEDYAQRDHRKYTIGYIPLTYGATTSWSSNNRIQTRLVRMNRNM